MIDRIIELSARNRFIVFLFVAAAAVAGWWSMKTIPLDAIPDLSDTQVIVYSRWDRSPDIMEDQVTYPIVSAMLGAPKVKDVRGFSDFGYSYVYIIFEEGTDIYWARSRTLEYLSKILPRLPQDVKTELGPDATGVGWVFQYALVDDGRHNLAELRSLQDWFLRYQLQAVPGVAEVAPLGGFVRQYQVNVDPNRLAAYGIPISKVVAAVRGGNNDVGGRLVEFTGREYMVRGRGYAQSTADLENIALVGQPVGRPGPGARCRQRDARPRHAARRRRPRRQGRSGLRHRRHAPGRECAARHRPGEGQAEGDRAGPARGRQDRHGLRPLGADPALHRQPEAHADSRN